MEPGMDTYEARLRMRDLAHDALDVVERRQAGASAGREDRSDLRQMATESRSLLGDAGYPGEATWRAIQRASIGLETAFEEPDRSYWEDLADELRQAIETLDNLIGVGRRDADVHIIG
jgi:hypothetical protein